ncbi:hypothetical protein BDCR2A_00105 [Borrelia duttonii CR2A]|uniref:Uncharacterized protein n=1 Tax=Borrelia duttonii CR2A TaxID=1432657 RepID=W6TGS9_9SPIR|nr:hypothetical protein BDCR2A_00105 [Borrelia duttonii CR2A]
MLFLFSFVLIMLVAIERSIAVPIFLIPAGARFINILSFGKVNSEFLIAAFILSLDSLISLPANPTISIPGIPFFNIYFNFN